MDVITAADWIQAGAAIVTAIAALTALAIAYKAPKLAAEWAERYRSQSEVEAEKQRLRNLVFISLMKCRRTILHADAIAALNLIDIAFKDCEAVRTAYRSFTEATLAVPYYGEVIVERYYALIEKLAIEMGYGDEITIFDVRNGYYPSGLGKLDEAAFAEAEAKIARRNIATKKKP